MKKILIVEDDDKIGRFLQLELSHEAYDVTLKNDGKEGYEESMVGNYDLIILDLMLPHLSGIEICRRIRRESETPIIMLTAKDDINDKVMGLDIGADDYMTKPFHIEELLARMRVALKKRRKDDKVEATNCYVHKGLRLYKDSYKVTYDDILIPLTKREFDLIGYLLENKNIVLSRDKIIEKVWGYDYVGETNVVDVYISYLRNKIDQAFSEPIIETVRGIGYIVRDN